MKNLLNKIMVGFVSCLIGFSSMAYEFGPVGTAEGARWGATHRVILTHADLTDTNLAVLSSQTITSGTIRANTAIVPLALVVPTAFLRSTTDEAADTNAFNFTTISVGDSASATQFITATQVNGNGTNVVVKLVAADAGTVSVTMQTRGAITSTVYSAQTATITTTVYTAQADNIGSNGNSVVTNIVAASTVYAVVTNIVAAGTAYAGLATNATATFSGSVTGIKSYTTADALRFAFIAQSNFTLSAFTKGQVEFYYKEVSTSP